MRRLIEIIKTGDLNRQSLCVILLLVFNLNGSGQNIEGIILDQETRKPIPFTAIKIKNQNVGTVSLENGTFKLNIDSSLQATNLIFYALGYQRDTIQANNYMQVLLKQKSILLEEVIVLNNKGKTRSTKHEIGYPSDRKGVWSHIVKEPFYQDGIKIVPELKKNSKYYIEGVELKLDWFLSKEAIKNNSPIRIRIYQLKDGLPDKELLLNSKLIFPNKSRSQIIFKYPIEFNENGVIICVEWIEGLISDAINVKRKSNFNFYGHAIKLHRVDEKELFDINSKVTWWQFNPNQQQWFENPNQLKDKDTEYTNSTFIPCIRAIVREQKSF